MPYLAFDIETTGLNRHSDVPIQFAYIQYDDKFMLQRAGSFYIKPSFGVWGEEAESVHGISREFLAEHGVDPKVAAATVYALCVRNNLVGYNSKGFDWELITYWLDHMGLPARTILSHLDVMTEWQRRVGKRQKLTELCTNLGYNEQYLSTLTQAIFKDKHDPKHPHSADYDTTATFMCHKALVQLMIAEAEKAQRANGPVADVDPQL